MKTNALHIISSVLRISVLFVVVVSSASFQVAFPLNRKYSPGTDRALVDVFANVVSRSDYFKKIGDAFLDTVRSTLRILNFSNPTELFSPTMQVDSTDLCVGSTSSRNSCFVPALGNAKVTFDVNGFDLIFLRNWAPSAKGNHLAPTPDFELVTELFLDGRLQSGAIDFFRRVEKPTDA